MKKLKLKKIVVGNLDEGAARHMYGGQDTLGAHCTASCTNQSPCFCSLDCITNACASGPGNGNCTRAAGGCTAGICPSNNTGCFSQVDCTYGHCTNQAQNCKATYTDSNC